MVVQGSLLDIKCRPNANRLADGEIGRINNLYREHSEVIDELIVGCRACRGIGMC